MSKAKGKDKKKGETSEFQKVVEEQKRQILEQTFTIKKLQDRLSRLTEENYEIVSTKDTFHANYEERLDKNRILIESHENTIKDKSEKIYELEVEKINLTNKVKNLERDLKQSENLRSRQLEEFKRLTRNEINKLETQLKEYNHYMSERDQMESENSNLKSTLEHEKEEKVRQVADKERQKVQATDKLRDEMLTTIRDMRTDLLSLKKEQLETTTRLAVLQNHQLTSELEFQSKQSEKLILENEELQKKVANLQRDLEIHKEIEEELAKRSHYSRGIIKKLTAKIGDLQEELGKKTVAQGESQEKQVGAMDMLQNDKKEEMIRALDKSLEFSEKKFVKVQTDLEVLSQENRDLKAIIERQHKKSDQLLGLLAKYYDEVLMGNLDQAQEQEVHLDLKALRKRKVEEWVTEEVRTVVTILLNQLASSLNRKSLGLPSINRSMLTVTDDDEAFPKIKFPKISEHSAISKLSGVNPSSDSKKLKDLPVNMASKIVASNVREWGRTVHSNSVSHLSRKYRVMDR